MAYNRDRKIKKSQEECDSLALEASQSDAFVSEREEFTGNGTEDERRLRGITVIFFCSLNYLL